MLELQNKVLGLVEQVRRLMGQMPYSLSSSLREVYDSPPYRALVALGPGILPLCIERMREGDWFLSEVVLSTGVLLSDLGLDDSEFPAEQEIAEAIIRWWDALPIVDMHWTAVSGEPSEVVPQKDEPTTVVRPDKRGKRAATKFPAVAPVPETHVA